VKRVFIVPALTIASRRPPALGTRSMSREQSGATGMAAAAFHIGRFRRVLTVDAAVLAMRAVRRHKALARRMCALLDVLHDVLLLDYRAFESLNL
jgi:hypothetical protein